MVNQRKAYSIPPNEIPSTYGNFDRVIEPFSLDSASVQVAKWKSRKTGLSLVWADVEGPLVNGYFTVATEIFNDSGVPHTLEHLIFLGSEKKILYATITSEGFTTEVYHINGKGEDAGVVYSEMQGRQNSSSDLMALCNQRLLYPPTSGYRSETGGLMEALRVLTVEQIRDYHNSYYRPHNMQLVITGSEEVEPSIIEHGQDKVPEGWKRPFLESPSKGGATLTSSQTVEIEFPEKDESIGEAQISWVGPHTNVSDPPKISPLSKRFIEIDSPLCTDIFFSPTDAEKNYLDRLPLFCPGEHLATLKIANQMEVDAHDSLSSVIISNFLYGNGNDLVSGLSEELSRYKSIANWSESQWSAEFKNWLKKLEEAQKINEKPYPDKFLSDFPVPSLESIKWIDVQLARGDKSVKSDLQKLIDEKDSTVVPFFLQFNHLFALIPTYLNSFFSLPIKNEDGSVLGFADVVHQLDTQTVELRITTTKALQNIPSRKRDGSEVCGAMYNQTVFSDDLAPASSINLFMQEKNLPRVLENLKSDPEAILEQMEKLRCHLLNPENVKISTTFGKEVLGPEGENPSGLAKVVSIPSIESSYAYHLAKGPQGFDPDQAALSVAISVLNGMESYLWKAIRGTGLAYGASMAHSPETGHVYLNIYRSPDSSKAFQEAKKVLEDLTSNKLEFTQLILESAKSSLAFSVASKVATAPAAAYRAFIDALKGVSQNSSRELLDRSKNVTREDVIESIKRYLLPIFDPKSSSALISSSNTRASDISESLKSMGYRVELKELKYMQRRER
ncbi:Metalloenzyme, LuxS/M16 peptidase-like protein [Phakopsora pachyrhizi]|uniref:Metalloenzyme, LuxS/M16 peptidase-like protein n=1 Tax=Phakopsora pachyrhizi TaxID=170000 RepID=A0AAV0BC75_PHAPC|nr:Metalloenzyme, LuxS/M16 peptidase-like protein [Phakopsora pachyrhizi]